MGAYDGVYLVGAGQTPYEKQTAKPVQRLIWEASDLALQSAGLGWSTVDGVGITSFTLTPDTVTTMTEHLGLECRWLYQGMYGGASGIIGMMEAARAIRAGDAEVAMIVTADTFDVSSHMTMTRNPGQGDYMGPWGHGAPNGMFALHTRLYMERYGATREDFGRFCTALRENALLNPNALFDKPLTMEDYLGARPIAEPIHLYDCVHPCSGADAVVLASEAIADQLDGPMVRLLGGGGDSQLPGT